MRRVAPASGSQVDAGVDVLLELLLDEPDELDESDFPELLDDELSLFVVVELDDVPLLEDVSVPRLSLR